MSLNKYVLEILKIARKIFKGKSSDFFRLKCRCSKKKSYIFIHIRIRLLVFLADLPISIKIYQTLLILNVV